MVVPCKHKRNRRGSGFANGIGLFPEDVAPGLSLMVYGRSAPGRFALGRCSRDTPDWRAVLATTNSRADCSRNRHHGNASRSVLAGLPARWRQLHGLLRVSSAQAGRTDLRTWLRFSGALLGKRLRHGICQRSHCACARYAGREGILRRSSPGESGLAESPGETGISFLPSGAISPDGRDASLLFARF